MRGFPVEINLEEGENNPEGLNDENGNVLDEAEVESGYVPTTPPKSDQGSDREQPGKRPRNSAEENLVPGPPDPEDPDDPEGGDSDDPSRRNIPDFFCWKLHGSTKFVVRAVALLSAKRCEKRII